MIIKQICNYPGAAVRVWVMQRRAAYRPIFCMNYVGEHGLKQ